MPAGFLAIFGGILKKRSHLEDPGVDGKVIFKQILLKMRREGVVWVHLT